MKKTSPQAPEWVKRIDKAIRKAFFPATHLKKAKFVEVSFAGRRPKDLPPIMQDPYPYGAWKGHELRLLHDVERAYESHNSFTSQQKHRVVVLTRKNIREQVLPEVVRACFCPRTVATLFFAGFAEGLKRRTFGPTGQIGDDIKIYLALSNNWQQMMKYSSSARDVRDWLSEHLKQDISLKRVEKIFERYGIKLRPRGRPPKKNSPKRVV